MGSGLWTCLTNDATKDMMANKARYFYFFAPPLLRGAKKAFEGDVLKCRFLKKRNTSTMTCVVV